MEDTNKRLIEMQAEQAKVNQALLEVLSKLAQDKAMPEMNPSELLEKFVQGQAVLGVESNLPSTYQALPDIEKVALPSKTELAKTWLSANPDHANMTGRELSENVKPHGVYISHVTWNKVKSEMTSKP